MPQPEYRLLAMMSSNEQDMCCFSNCATRTPRTELPMTSSLGLQTQMPNMPGTTRKMFPLTPLLAGRPTVQAHSPEKSYIPQALRMANVCFASVAAMTARPDNGQVPKVAYVAAAEARSRVFTRVAQTRR